MSENSSESAAAWDAIQPGHGIVAVDPQWAADQGVMESHRHPKDDTKSVYVIEAYHALHCLVRIPVDASRICIDAIYQYNPRDAS